MPEWSALAGRVGWQDMVDVAVLTLLTFRLYLWVRGTIAVQLLGGLAVLLIAALAAARAGLILTAYVLQAISAASVLAVVVVFQPEIRRALRGADPVRWWRRRKSGQGGPDSQRFAPLARALLALARDRIGALVIVPRLDDVNEHLTGGTTVDAALSPEMLAAIFQTSSPVHDGAVVVQRGRIACAGAFLPLSTSAQLPDEMGTRHRAAVGLSESCDALALVVSEERGEVSLASGGRLSRAPRSADELAARIDTLVRTGEDGTVRAATQSHAVPRRRPVDLLALTAIALLVCGAWFVVVGDRSTQLTRQAVVELRGSRDDIKVELVQPAHGEVSVLVRGPRRLLQSLGAGDVSAWVDLGKVERGRRRLPVRAAAPPGIEVVDVVPAQVVLRVRPAR